MKSTLMWCRSVCQHQPTLLLRKGRIKGTKTKAQRLRQSEIRRERELFIQTEETLELRRLNQ
ncbi:hypothetical protein EYF80_059332 [Liparis tanakae]|uniref:Uncharacterized protein n=1 Tax=Liparis tanakae TaxID=230148 RepID=A0A4Z2ENN9_9TELE|nr:hypothetical protein EYF80_059332 [Liparis tanakae]